MAQYNVLNVPAVHQAAQQANANKFNMGRAEVNAERQDQQWDEEQQFKNTRNLLAGIDVFIKTAQEDPENLVAAHKELTDWYVEQGIMDASKIQPITGPQDVDMQELMRMRTGLAAELEKSRPMQSQQAGGGVGKTWINPETGTMWGMTRQGQPFDTGVPAQQYANRTIETGSGTQTFNPGNASVGGVLPGTDAASMRTRKAADARAIEIAKTQGGRAGSAVDLTPAELEVDKKFAAEYNDFMLGGGADAEKGLQQLGEVVGLLESGEYDLTGWRVAATPDWLKVVTDPEALNARDQVEEVVQRNLRLVLGPQFTEEEGKRLIARAYNPALEEKYNIIRVKRLMTAMQSSLDAKRSAAIYFQQNGTLKGWNGDPTALMPKTKAQVEAEVDGLVDDMDKASGAIAAAERAIRMGRDRNAVIQRLKENGIDPSGL